MIFKNLSKRIFFLIIWLLARLSFQFYWRKLLRIILSFLGYMNWSSDFKLTGERHLMNLYKKYNIRKVLDIGANTGQYSEQILKSTSAKVIAFEPQVSVASSLIKLSNKYPNRFTYRLIAIGDVNEKVSVNVHSSSTELSFINSTLLNHPLLTGKVEKTISVQQFTVDYILKNRILELDDVDLIKIDVEGYEANVLRGARNFISKTNPKFIQVEMNWHHLFTGTTLWSLSQLLKGYEVYRTLPYRAGLIKIDPANYLDNIFQLATYLFINTKKANHIY